MTTTTIGLQPTGIQVGFAAPAPTLTGPGKGINRDRWGRPLIVPPGGGTPVPYTRCTTYVSVLDDKEHLMKWKARMTAIGMAARDDLILRVRSADPDDKTTIGRAAEEAAEHAGASRRADIGTSLHALTERLDRGETLPPLGDWQADIDAYQHALTTHGLTPVEIETFVVNDDLKIGGTFDRIYEIGGQNYIGDLKTGSSVDWGAGTYAMQLAVYANSVCYNVETGQRSTLDVNRDLAVLVHLPAGEHTATVYWINIARGWDSVQRLAGPVRQWRKLKAKDWLAPMPSLAPVQPATPPVVATSVPASIEDQINQAATLDALTSVYLAHMNEWTEEHTRLAKARKTTLTSQVQGQPE
ncbi:PD-(D/E)XK nuclease family protein [Trueperella pyogenes]|uniref:PD-(D/E)XK nuclease family protein n=1 Tax=Trueperella pyogenes TaxID=1661 RepID=UPI0032515DB4